jgi:hypothetical protein
MSETQSYPYETHLDIYYKSLEVIDEKALADACTAKWYNQTLCQVNQSVVRLGVVQGEYQPGELFYLVVRWVALRASGDLGFQSSGGNATRQKAGRGEENSKPISDLPSRTGPRKTTWHSCSSSVRLCFM